MKEKEKGISTIEILISILISSLALVSSSKILDYVLSGDKIINDEIKREKNILKANQILLKIIKDMESHPLKLTPRIQRNGSFKFTDNSSHSYEVRVNKKSDLITYGEFIFNDLLRIKEKKHGLKDIIACEVFKDGRFTKSKYKSLVGITNNYFYELKIININKMRRKPDCYLLSLVSSKSIFFKSDMLASSIHINYLLPIKALYTIFLDNDLTLRYLSSIHNEIRENQPIRNDFFKLKFEISKYKLSIRNIKLSLGFKFIKESSINTLLNLSEFKNEK